MGRCESMLGYDRGCVRGIPLRLDDPLARRIQPGSSDTFRPAPGISLLGENLASNSGGDTHR